MGRRKKFQSGGEGELKMCIPRNNFRGFLNSGVKKDQESLKTGEGQTYEESTVVASKERGVEKGGGPGT